MTIRIFAPCDSTALALRADDVAALFDAGFHQRKSSHAPSLGLPEEIPNLKKQE